MTCCITRYTNFVDEGQTQVARDYYWCKTHKRRALNLYFCLEVEEQDLQNGLREMDEFALVEPKKVVKHG